MQSFDPKGDFRAEIKTHSVIDFFVAHSLTLRRTGAMPFTVCTVWLKASPKNTPNGS